MSRSASAPLPNRRNFYGPRRMPQYSIRRRSGPHLPWEFLGEYWTLHQVSDVLGHLRGKGYEVLVRQADRGEALIRLAPGDEWEGSVWR